MTARSAPTGACVSAFLLLMVGPVTAMAHPAGSGTLDGINVIEAPTPEPFGYFNRKQEAERLADDGHFAEAEALADRLVVDYSIDGDNWALAARVKRHLGKYAEAARDYRRAMELLGPGPPNRAEYWLAASEAAAGNTKDALDVLEHLVAEDHYLFRPSLAQDEAFTALRAEPRFLQIAGHQASESWTRNEGWRRDIDYLVSEVKRVNPDFHDRPLPQLFEQNYHQLRSAVPKLSDEQIYVGMSRMLTSLHQGHTALWPFIPASRMTFKALPLQLYVFPEGVFIVGASAGQQDLVGAKLEKIESVPALEALRRVGEIQEADSGMEVAWLGPANLALAQTLRGLGIASRTDRIEVTVRAQSGAEIKRTIPTTSTISASKLHAASGHEAPLALRSVDKAHWFEALPEDHAIYAQVNQIADDPDETLDAFALRLRAALKDDKVRNVILDLRHDNGGNTFMYVELLRTLIGFSQRDGRQLYVVIGRGTYSAAANLATDLERLALPVFIGEPTSMTGNNYGDESEVILPYSGIRAGVSGVKWGLGYPYDQRRSIVPQVPIAMTAADYFSGRDPILETAKVLCERRTGKLQDAPAQPR
jgi:tetratricopeptide (TPR) repeat protein